MPGWKFDDDPSGQHITRQDLPGEKLTGDIARRPLADSVVFGRTFNTAEFATAHDIVREEAAQYGATDQSSLFNEQSRRDYDVQGNGFEFKLGGQRNPAPGIGSQRRRHRPVEVVTEDPVGW